MGPTPSYRAGAGGTGIKCNSLITVAAPKWRSLCDSVNYGDEFNRGNGFGRATFFCVSAESAQYL